MRDRRRIGLKLLQWTVAGAALLYVAASIEWRRLGAELVGMDAAVLAAVLIVTAVEFASRFSMWYVLLNGRVRTSFATSARIDLVIKFVNHVLPSKASGHSVAPLVLRHFTSVGWAEAVTVAGLNTGLYATLYGLVTLVGVALFAASLPGGLLAVVLVSGGMYLVAGALVLLAGRRMDAVGSLTGRLEALATAVPRVGTRLAGLVGKIPAFTADSARVFRRLSTRPTVVGPYVLGWAGTLMVAPGVRTWLLLREVGDGFEPALLLPVALVVAYSVTILPITPGGIGVAEASATLLLTSLGVAPGVAGIVVLLDRLFGVYFPALLGWAPTANVDLAALFARGDETE